METQSKVTIIHITCLIVSIFLCVLSLFTDYLLNMFSYNFRIGKDTNNNESQHFCSSMERKAA